MKIKGFDGRVVITYNPDFSNYKPTGRTKAEEMAEAWFYSQEGPETDEIIALIRRAAERTIQEVRSNWYNNDIGQPTIDEVLERSRWWEKRDS